MIDTIISSLSLVFASVGAVFVYYKFFREGTHRQRIEFDIELIDLGIKDENRVIELSLKVSNKGNVEQKFDDIRLTVRGISESEKLSEIIGHEPRILFPEKIGPISLIPDKYGYFFVRPSVTQRFPIVLKIPVYWCLLHARATFKYSGQNEIHSAERAFKVEIENA